jgi:hypothetical protein
MKAEMLRQLILLMRAAMQSMSLMSFIHPKSE